MRAASSPCLRTQEHLFLTVHLDEIYVSSTQRAQAGGGRAPGDREGRTPETRGQGLSLPDLTSCIGKLSSGPGALMHLPDFHNIPSLRAQPCKLYRLPRRFLLEAGSTEGPRHLSTECLECPWKGWWIRSRHP